MSHTTDFYQSLEENQPYSVVTMLNHVYDEFEKNHTKGKDFERTHIKQKNVKHNEDAIIEAQKKIIKKAYKAIDKRKFELNHK